MTWLVCLLAFSSLCIIGEALTRRDMFHVMLFCAVLMNMLSATAGTMVEFGPVITNFGSVIYSVITFCIGVLAFRTPGRIPLSLVILAMATWLIVLASIERLPVAGGNDQYRQQLGDVMSIYWRVSAVSLLMLWIAQGVNVGMARLCHRRGYGMASAVFIAAVTAQIVDSAFFFPLAFPGTSIVFIAHGLLVKCTLAALASAGVLVLSRRARCADLHP